jgi:hypothetical protein
MIVLQVTITKGNLASQSNSGRQRLQEESDEVKDHPQEALTQLDPADKVGRTWRVAKKGMVWLRG